MSRSFSEGKERKWIAFLRLTTPHRQYIQLLVRTGWSSSLSGLYTLEGRVFSNHLPVAAQISLDVNVHLVTELSPPSLPTLAPGG